MKTPTAPSPAPSTPASGSTKSKRSKPNLGDIIRLANWPACLSDKAVAESVAEAVYEGYEQKSGHRTGLYRVR
jgi:hypothetical protein